MSALRERMIADMTSAGLAASTKAVYIQGVRALAKYYRRSPDQLSEGEVRSYLLHLRDERGAARGTFQPHHGGIRFLFAHTLDRDWSLFSKKEGLREVVWVISSPSEGWQHAREDLQAQVFLVA